MEVMAAEDEAKPGWVERTGWVEHIQLEAAQEQAKHLVETRS